MLIKYVREIDAFFLGLIRRGANGEFTVWVSKSIPGGPIARDAFGDEIVNKCLSNPEKEFKIEVSLNDNHGNTDKH
jgi:hypothetical protein